MSEKIIRSSKIKMPKPRKHSILRKTLFSKLKQLDTCKVCLIDGWAGIGKTTLLSTYFHTTEKAVAWITLDEDCNYIEVFWTYMKELLLQAEYTDITMAPKYSRNIKEEVAHLLNKLDDMENILVLDNVHVLKNKEVLDFISEFLTSMDSGIHVVLCGRDIPDIYFGRLMMEGDIFYIHEQDLLFSKVEELQFLKHTLGLTYGHDVLLSMCEQANGWVGGLQLMSIALSGKNIQQIQQLQYADTNMDAYITKEIFDTMQKQEQYFLLAISILESFDILFLEEYLPELPVKQFLSSIWKQHFILSILDDERGIYCLHDILKEYLRHQFSNIGRDIQYDLRNRAAQVCKNYGEYQECIHHYIMNADYHSAMMVLCDTPQDQKVLHYLKQIPMDIICENPDFAYQYFFYYYANFEEEACIRIYNMICEKFHDDITFAAFRFFSMFLNGDYMKQEFAVLPFEDLMQLPLKKETKSFLLIKDAFLLSQQHQSEKSRQYLEKTMEIYEETGNVYIGSMLFLVQTQIYEFIGEFHNAMQAYARLDALVLKLPFQKSYYYVGVAGIYLKQYRIQDALEALRLCEECNTKRLFMIYRAGLYTKAQVYCALQDERAMNMIEELLQETLYSDLFIASSLLRLLYVWKPRHSCFHEFLNRYESDPHRDYDSMLLYASLMEAQGEKELAHDVVLNVLKDTRKNNNTYSLIEACLLELHFLIQESSSCKHMENVFIEAVTYASKNDIVLPFLILRKEWDDVVRLMKGCIAYRLTNAQRVFVQNLPLYKKSTILTQREEEVLKTLAEGKSNKDIAQILCISLATVKTHILNIYSKLHLNNRIEATNYYHDKK